MIKDITSLSSKYGISISGLGYYPNPLTSDTAAQRIYVDHIKRLIGAASRLGVPVVNTFIGRDHTKSVEDNWPVFLEIWRDIIAEADATNIKIGIENCPMSFTQDEWPGAWEQIPSPNFGLNYDPSHMIIQHMDVAYPIMTFPERLHHVHAKDARIDPEQLNEHGILSYPNLWHTPKLPGMGDVDWPRFFSYLTSVGYDGAVCVEVEDRAYEGNLEQRIAALRQSYNYLRQFIP